MNKSLHILKYTLLLGLIVTLSMGCSSDQEPRFTLPVEVIFQLPSGLNSVETHFVQVSGVPNFLQTQLDQNNMSIDNISSIVPGRAQIIPLSQNIEYRFFNDVSINALSITNLDLLDEMFYNDFVELDHTGNLELLSSISELKPIMINGVFDMEVVIKLRQSTLVSSEHRLVLDLAVYD